jgi:hypothetical protein
VRRAAGCNRRSLPSRTTIHPHPPPHACGQRRLQPHAGLAPAHRQSKQASTHTGAQRTWRHTRTWRELRQEKGAEQPSHTAATECCARTSARFWAASASARTRAVSACTKPTHVSGRARAQGENRTHAHRCAGRHQAQGRLSARRIAARGPWCAAQRGPVWQVVPLNAAAAPYSTPLPLRHGPHTTGGKAHGHGEGLRGPARTHTPPHPRRASAGPPPALQSSERARSTETPRTMMGEG